MTVVGIAMMRNEADVAAPVVRHMLAEVDRIIVADNNSTDGTWGLLEGIADPRLTIVDEPRVAFYQPDTMMRLVAMAPEADWIVPFDADEWWYATDGRRIADALSWGNGTVVTVPSWEMVPQPSDDSAEPDPFKRIVWRRQEANTQKVAFRPGPGRTLGMGNHWLVDSMQTTAGRPLGIRHYPYRTLEQTRRKVQDGKAALEATDYIPGIGQHWRRLGALGDPQLRAWLAEWSAPVGLVAP